MSDDSARSSLDVPLEAIVLDEPVAVRPRRPRVWTVWLVLAVAVVLYFLTAITVMLALTVWRHGPEVLAPSRVEEAVTAVSQSAVGFLGTMLSIMAVFAGVAIFAAVVSPVAWRERLRLGAARISPLAVVVSICGVLAISLVLEGLIGLGGFPESEALKMLSDLIRGLSGGSLVAAVLVIGIAPGIAEELLFRGYVQTRFSQRWGPGWGILWASLLFGLMHMELVHGTFAVALGIYLGYLTERTGSIRPAMICHAANNTISVLTTSWNVEIVGIWANVAALVGGIVILCLALWHLTTSVKPSRSHATC